MEQGDVLQQLPGGQKALQSTFFHIACLQILQISELFQNFFDMEEQSSFLQGSYTLKNNYMEGSGSAIIK